MPKIHSNGNLKTFMSFYCEKHSLELQQAIRSSIEVFNYCVPARETVLSFYSELFDEFGSYYWILKKRSMGPVTEANKVRVEYVGEHTRRFYEMAKLRLADAREDQLSDCGHLSLPTPKRVRTSSSKSTNFTAIAGPASPTASQSCSSPTTAPKVIPIAQIPISRRTSSCNSTDMDQTPMSPSAQESETNLENGASYDSDGLDIFAEIESFIPDIRTAFEDLLTKYMPKNRRGDSSSEISEFSKRQSMRLKSMFTRWASESIVRSNTKHSDLATQIALYQSKTNPSSLLSNEVALWLGNPVNKLLVDLLLESHDDIQSLVHRLVGSTQNCDWLLAYILLELSKNPDYDKKFSSCMEHIIGYQSAIKSVTHILAYLSDANPKAMANFPKSNIPFLISLCQTSTSLLSVLSQEIPDSIDPDFLNNLAKEVLSRQNNQINSSFLTSLTHCIMAAPNSYKLLLLTFDAKLGRVTDEVKTSAQFVIDSISIKIHERAVTSLTMRNMNTQPIHIVDRLLEQIDADPSKLIEKCTGNRSIQKKIHEIFFRMSLIYGNLFASKIICHYLNLPESTFWRQFKPLLNKFMKHFGDDGSTLVSQTLSLDPSLRSPNYWLNIHKLTTLIPEMKLYLDLISQLLIDKLCASTFDIISIAQLMKLCNSSLERVDHSRISISTMHRLCIALATCFFLLLEYESDNFPEILSYIRISLTCMSLLKQSSVASNILCRALLERSLVYGHLFNENFNPELIGDRSDSSVCNQDNSIRLSKENLKVTLGHRFRRLPNHVTDCTSSRRPKIQTIVRRDPDTPDKHSINCYLLIEAFKSSINDIEAFANLFVEFNCPVMFDKHLWPNDDALRVINERNLSILRKFEQVPPLWDLYELIGQASCLKNCLVLVKALLAAHLALWASATTNSSRGKTISTSRLIPPMADSGLVPRAFGLTVEVFPHLAPNEVFSVLSDIWQYLKDTNSNNNSDIMLSPEEQRSKAKVYLNRLRLFMCQHIPGSLYVKIFKEFQSPLQA